MRSGNKKARNESGLFVIASSTNRLKECTLIFQTTVDRHVAYSVRTCQDETIQYAHSTRNDTVHEFSGYGCTSRNDSGICLRDDARNQELLDQCELESPIHLGFSEGNSRT